MKKLLPLALIVMFISCTNQEAEQPKSDSATIDKLFKPTYTDNFKIGNPENILLIEKMHQGMISKDFELVGELIDENAVFYMEDGATIQGKQAMLNFMEANFTQITLKNYSVGVSIAVVGENGDEWVLMWDTADIETPDGNTQKVDWMDAFQIADGKIVAMNGFVKSPKEQ
jgi:predicted SnoaL-like aldol condensation-catalyzing enzyme